MNKELILPSNIQAIEAQYKEQYLEEYNENPFIQALPKMKSKEEIIRALAYNPKISMDEITLDSNIRVHLLQRIYKVFQPLPTHLKIWNSIDTLIRQGYVARNPYSVQYKKHLNLMGNKLINKDFSLDTNDNFRTTASCGLIIGFSGMGKTTTVNRVLSKIPQVVAHNSYKGNHFNHIQVPWIKLEAPHNGSLKALTLQFFMKVDELLGTENMKRYVSRNLSVDAMLPLMGQLSQNIGLGLLIIDELQHLNRSGANQIMNYFVALTNTFGVPILLIGTPGAYDMLQSEMRIARRTTGNSEVIWNNMNNDKEFRLFMKGVWRYQWLVQKAELTEEIINVFHEKTQGISDLVVKLFVNTQKRAIETGKEVITIGLIEKVWNEEFKLLKPMIEAIASGNQAKIFKYDDIRKLDSISQINSKILNSDKEVRETTKMPEKNIREQYEKVTDNKKKINIKELSKDDIRKIVLVGLKNSKSEYESLKDAGVIKNLEFLGLGDYI